MTVRYFFFLTALKLGVLRPQFWIRIGKCEMLHAERMQRSDSWYCTAGLISGAPFWRPDPTRPRIGATSWRWMSELWREKTYYPQGWNSSHPTHTVSFIQCRRVEMQQLTRDFVFVLYTVLSAEATFQGWMTRIYDNWEILQFVYWRICVQDCRWDFTSWRSWLWSMWQRVIC
jgi:hypothetical protein